jgi:ribosome biogenesis GTPase A
MPINWFPGHMNNTRQALAALMPGCDVIIELLDARMPLSSSNPLLDELRRNVPGKGENGAHGDVPCITLLTKADLADPKVTPAWQQYLHDHRGVKTIAVCLNDKQDIKRLPNLIKKLALKKNRIGKPLRAMIVGIPNVGKSTLVNALRGKRIARVGDEPAVTKGRQEVKLDSGIVLVDTPGILWPKLEGPEIGMRLALSGAIKDTAYEYTDLAVPVVRWLQSQYPDALKARYKLDAPGVQAEPTELLETIGKKRGCLVAGGEVDLSRTCELLLREIRNGKLGRLSLERPESTTTP